MPQHDMSRPKRRALPDFAGRPLSLPEDQQSWECLGKRGNDILLLGTGPGQAETLPFTRGAGRIYWLDAPAGPASLRRTPFPGNWRQVAASAVPELARYCSVFFYRPGLRLAPEFWGPLLGRVESGGVPYGNAAQGQRLVILPGNDRQLLHRELRDALRRRGLEVAGERLDRLPCAGRLAALREMLSIGRAAVFVSVNLRGLDGEGRVFYFCRSLGIPVAIWFVDNPWQVLSAARLPWWRDAVLFATDRSFVPRLKAAGARRVFCLPLAVAQHMWRELPQPSEMDAPGQVWAREPPLFVGRSAFPGKERFFAAASVPGEALSEAGRVLERAVGPAQGPQFHWWCRKLGIDRPWPGAAVRNAGLGAEECSRQNRVRWLSAGLACGMRIVGDADWARLVPGAVPEAPVDYYTALPGWYFRARAVLNVTSLLLPHSLSQRHFDVWAAGGYLLTDLTPGLELFPDCLLKPIILRRPEELRARLYSLAENPERALRLRRAWREHLLERHTYVHRINTLLQALGCPAA